MIKSIICAYGNGRVIGKDNELLWHLSADLQRFKSTTMGHTMIMGRKTFESIGKALPGRKTIIITRNPEYHVDGCETVTSIDEAFKRCEGEEEVFITGGAEIYNQTLNIADRMYLTEVDIETEGDAFFPEFNPKKWNITLKEPHDIDEKNMFQYTFINYERKK